MNCVSLLSNYLGRDLLVEDEDRPGAVLLSLLFFCAFPPEEQRALESVFGYQNLDENKIFLRHCTLGVNVGGVDFYTPDHPSKHVLRPD